MSQLNQNSIALEELKIKAASLPAAITIDSTLTQSGQAADAKAVGDKFANHTQSASTISSGRFIGTVYASFYNLALDSVLRNSSLTPANVGEAAPGEGEICWTYE